MSKINFKDKHIRYGGYGAFLTLLVIAITIVLNIVATNLNIKIDTTSEQIFSLSDTTKDLAKSIENPINLYVLEETGKEEGWLQEILLKYSKLNNNINIVYKDPVLYPAFGTDYLNRSNQNLTSISMHSIIVENTVTGKFKIVPASELMQSTDANNQNGQQTGGVAITVENAITNAIGYVLTDKDGLIYYTTGHQEITPPSALLASCDKTNLTTNQLSLLTDDMPDPSNSVLAILSPHSDFTQEEVDKVIKYLTEGGKAIITMDADVANLTVFDQILSYYGVTHEAGIAVETNSKNMTSVYPTYLLPNKGKHAILQNMTSSSATIILPNASGFAALPDARTNLNITPLLTTSDNAFLKTDFANAKTLTKESGDIDGPITLAYAIEDPSTGVLLKSGDYDHTKLIVLGNSYGLSNDYINVSATGNESFITSSLGWLLSVNTNYTIEGKTKDTYELRPMSTTTMLLINGFIVVVIPLIVAVIGIVVCVKRRHA